MSMNDNNELFNSLQFIISKQLSVVLDKIAEDFGLDRCLFDKYLEFSLEQSNKPPVMKTSVAPATNNQLSTVANICQGKTKKGDPCSNKPKPGLLYCGKHLSN